MDRYQLLLGPHQLLKPYYSIDIDSMKEIDLSAKGIAVMAVDNLPSELPREC